MRKRSAVLLVLVGLLACEPPPAAPVMPPHPAPSASSAAPVAEVAPAPVNAGALPPPVATTPPPSGPSPICAQLDAASAAGPATEPDGITRAIVIDYISSSWGDFEGGSEDSTLYPSGFYRFSRFAPLSGQGPKKNGYYAVTDRKALQETFDNMAQTVAVERIVKEYMEPPALSMPGLSWHTTVAMGTEHIAVRGRVEELSAGFVGAAEPAGFSRPGVKGHHLADVKVLHATSRKAIDCIGTFDHRQALLFAAVLTKSKSVAVKAVGTTSSPPVADAERVVAGLTVRFRACYTHGTPEDLKRGGKFHLRATVSPTGDVSSTTIVDAGGFSGQLQACFKRAVTNSQFAAPGGSGATVDIPLLLVPPVP